ncbi:MAG: hypothetical protein WC523_01715 [Patescibacteria group bacterium]|jgi:hypothetical protein
MNSIFNKFEADINKIVGRVDRNLKKEKKSQTINPIEADSETNSLENTPPEGAPQNPEQRYRGTDWLIDGNGKRVSLKQELNEHGDELYERDRRKK